EHFVKAQRIRAVFRNDLVGIDHVAASLRHFLAVFAEDQPLIDQFEKGLWRRDDAEVEKKFVPKTRVEKMENRVLGAPDVKINTRGGLLAAGAASRAHPIFFGSAIGD